MNIFVPTRWTFLKLLACPLVSTTLGLILLEIGVKKIKEAKMGVNGEREVISFDIYIDIVMCLNSNSSMFSIREVEGLTDY